MGRVEPPAPVLRIAAIFSRHDQALDWARRQLSAAWGDVALESGRWDFDQTEYYERSMGANLKKQWLAFLPLVDCGELPSWKLQANAWEDAYRGQADHPEPRPLNIDPGYVTLAKLVLASTKDRDHRLYVGGGIHAENTLYFQSGEWRFRPWTYADYRTPQALEFFTRCRELLRA